MRIEQVEVIGVAVPLVGDYKTAHSSKSIQKSVVVRITASDGAVGIGNVDPSPGYSPETFDQTLAMLRTCMAPRIVGMDAENIHEITLRLDAISHGFQESKAAIEMACTDLVARSLGMPVHTYLGGAVRTVLHFNAWIGIVSAAQAAIEAVKWQQLGFRSAKIKVGGGIESDKERVRAVREAVGENFHLRIDANAGYDTETAIKLARMMSPYNLQLFEQPVPAADLEGMAKVRCEAGELPIMADESLVDHSSLIRIIRANAADMVKVKVMKQGGLRKTLDIITTAEAAGIQCVIGHGFGLGVNTMAEIMLAATSHNIVDGIECVGPLKTADDIVTEKLDLNSGSVSVPNGPGLNVTLDQVKLERYRVEDHIAA
ncbi:MAG TPA: mandelate racemase/muconate lactonizing enzyme family protein [Eoetvoesiella sp.]